MGELSLDSPTTTTISTQDTYTQISGATSLGNETTMVTSPSAGTLQYNGQDDAFVHVTASATVTAPAGDTFAVVIAKNGTAEPPSEINADGVSGVPIPIATTGVEDLTSGDTLSVQIKNIDGTGNMDVELYNMAFIGFYTI